MVISDMTDTGEHIHATLTEPLIVPGYKLKTILPARIAMLQLNKEKNILDEKTRKIWLVELQCLEQIIDANVIYHCNIHDGIKLGLIEPPTSYFEDV